MNFSTVLSLLFLFSLFSLSQFYIFSIFLSGASSRRRGVCVCIRSCFKESHFKYILQQHDCHELKIRLFSRRGTSTNLLNCFHERIRCGFRPKGRSYGLNKKHSEKLPRGYSDSKGLFVFLRINCFHSEAIFRSLYKMRTMQGLVKFHFALIDVLMELCNSQPLN